VAIEIYREQEFGMVKMCQVYWWNGKKIKLATEVYKENLKLMDVENGQ